MLATFFDLLPILLGFVCGAAGWRIRYAANHRERARKYARNLDREYARRADGQHAQVMHSDLRGIYGDYSPYDLSTGKLVDVDAISDELAADDPIDLEGHCDCDICRRRLQHWLDAEAQEGERAAREFEAARIAEVERQHRDRQAKRGWGRRGVLRSVPEPEPDLAVGRAVYNWTTGRWDETAGSNDRRIPLSFDDFGQAVHGCSGCDRLIAFNGGMQRLHCNGSCRERK